MIKEFSELTLETSFSFSTQISVEQLERYAEISGDFNPLHINAEYAIKKGFSNQVVHGLLSSSLFSKLIGMHLPGERALILNCNLMFRNPIYPDEKIEISGKVVNISESTQSFELKTLIKNEKQKKVTGNFNVKLI
jgi:3-hydroxybutyryl-CoA dehydratase